MTLFLYIVLENNPLSGGYFYNAYLMEPPLKKIPFVSFSFDWYRIKRLYVVLV